jgi:hypothetical protein
MKAISSTEIQTLGRLKKKYYAKHFTMISHPSMFFHSLKGTGNTVNKLHADTIKRSS